MKKLIILTIVFALFSVYFFGNADQPKKDDPQQRPHPNLPDAITKTYILKHVSPVKVEKTLRQYFWTCSYDKNGNLFTVRIPRDEIAKFESLLRMIDVEKKKILIRIFTVIASNRPGKHNDLQNRDLKQVITELQKVLSFSSFRLDGVSAVTVVDDQDDSMLTLSSQSQLKLRLKGIQIKEGVQGARNIAFNFELSQLDHYTKEGQSMYESLIASDTSIKENGYLVAGVSKIGKTGDSLILIINAEIK